MINEINSDIESINSNIEVLPKNNKKNIEKYNEYIDQCLNKYNPIVVACENEIKIRYSRIYNKFKDLVYTPIESKIDYNALKLSDNRVAASEKMNLDYLFFKLENQDGNNLSDENEIIIQIIGLFNACGVVLTEKDFIYSENVNLYIKALLNNEKNIQDIFNNIFWQTPDIIKQIELNIRYLYYKNENKLNEFFKVKYQTFDFHTFITNHRNGIYADEMVKHKSIKYIYDLFINKELDVDDFLVESRVQDLINSLLTNPSNERNYENLLKLKKSLLEYKGFAKYEYIIKDFKALFAKREEYKLLFSNKLKDIAKKEKNLFALNKKISKKGLFKLSKSKLADTKLQRNNLIIELDNDYKELDDLKIKETINKYVSNETNYYDVLKLTTYNFNYFVKLLKSENEEINIENIDNKLLELNKFIYDSSAEIINNITIAEEKNIPKIISDMYKLNSLIVDETKISPDQVDRLIENVDKLLIYFDIYTLMMNLKEIKFLIEAPEVLKKYQ